MKIQKTELAQKLNKIKSVVPKKTTQAVLQGILVKDGYLIANNMEMTVKAKIEGTTLLILFNFCASSVFCIFIL